MSCRWRENVAHACHVAVNSRTSQSLAALSTTSQLSTLCGLFHILFVLFVSPTFLLMLHHFPLSNQITYNFLEKASRYEFADKIRSTSWGHVGQRSLHTSGTGSKLIGSRCSRGLHVLHCVCAQTFGKGLTHVIEAKWRSCRVSEIVLLGTWLPSRVSIMSL